MTASDPIYQSARAHLVAFDCASHGRVEARGPEAGRFLHNLCTNDVLKLTDGSLEVLFTTGQAKLVGHGWIWRTEPDAYFVDAGPNACPKLFQHLDRHLISEKLELTDRSADLAQVHLTGPAAAAWPELERLPARRLAPRKWLGWPGIDLVVPISEKQALLAALAAAGVPLGSDELLNLLRLETGMPLYGRDMDDTCLPQEVNRVDEQISFTKGCYIGQETVARIRTYGHVNRMLLKLRLAGERLPGAGAKLSRNGQDVGRITSAVQSPEQGMIALGFVRRGHQERGAKLEWSEDGAAGQAEVL